MKITDIQAQVVKVKLKSTFKIAFSEQNYMESVFIRIQTDEGIEGYGEAHPFAPVTGETVSSILGFLEKVKPLLIDQNPLGMERMHNLMESCITRNTAAKAGIDLALFDILGKKAGLPVYQILGGNVNSVQTDMTIGIDAPDEMANKAKTWVENGFRILKIKTGIDADQDIEAIAKIREAVGPTVKLKIDANQGWGIKVTSKAAKEMEKYGVDSIEQPLKADNVDGLKFLRGQISQELMADESVHTPKDAIRLIKKEAVDILNIKLMKSGGLYPAIAINNIAESAGIPCMIGCMTETRLGITAAASLMAAKKNIIYGDLDSFTLVDEIQGLTGGFTQDKDTLTLLDKPGFGIDLAISF